MNGSVHSFFFLYLALFLGICCPIQIPKSPDQLSSNLAVTGSEPCPSLENCLSALEACLERVAILVNDVETINNGQ